MNAVILLNKPSGMTSFAAVRKCSRILNEKRAGHTGTLDPNATGLMILLFGSYTKLVPFACSNHKVYEAEFLLGKASDTGDIWGSEIAESPWHEHDQEELDDASRSFLGEIQQVPPMYSAVRYQGKKLYEYAREGKTVERKPRTVTVNELSVTCLHENVYHMHACVSSGTYIRTLISDYAEKLGELAEMSSLQRTSIEGLSLKDASGFDEISQGKGRISPFQVISPDWKLVETDDLHRIGNGQTFHLDCAYDRVIFTHEGILLAAYEKKADGNYHCVRGLK